MVPHENDILQLAFSEVQVWLPLSLEAIATLKSGEIGNFWKVPIYFVHDCLQTGKP